MKNWMLFFLGTIAYFDIRFINRKDKNKFDIRFWLRDNWPELLLTFILDLIAMIILMDANTDLTIWLISKLPDGLVLPVKLLFAALCGLGFGAVGYETIKRTLKKK